MRDVAKPANGMAETGGIYPRGTAACKSEALMPARDGRARKSRVRASAALLFQRGARHPESLVVDVTHARHSRVAADFSWMIGRRVVQVSYTEPVLWFFSLGDSAGIQVECPWRLLDHGRIAVSGDDHGQQFGLPQPIDAATSAARSLVGRAILRAEVREGTADLLISFEEGLCLDIVPFSSGHESWQVTNPAGGSVIAQGGGQLSGWSR